MRNCAVYTLVSLAVLLSAGPMHADVPLAVAYQGLLLDAAGAPRNGNVSVILRILDDPNAGTLVYEEVHAGAPVVDGIFDLEIGAGLATVGGTRTVFGVAVFDSRVRFLELEIEGEILGPRQAILAVPYALRSQEAVNADTVDGSHARDLDQSAHAISSTNPHRVSRVQVGAAALSHGHSGRDIARDSISAREIAANAVGSSEVANESLTALDLAPDSVRSSEIATGAVDFDEIATGAVRASEIAANAVGASEIASAAVRRSEISGTEVALYVVLDVCGGSSSSFTLDATCRSGGCFIPGTIPSPGFLRCDGSCRSITSGPLPATCNNTRVGYLLSPTIP